MSDARRVMTCIYDLGKGPVTYDILVYLRIIEAIAKRQNMERAHVLFVPGRRTDLGGYRNDDKPVSRASRDWRRDHILIPACQLAGVGYTVCASREDAQDRLGPFYWPPEWRVDNPVTFYHYLIFKDFLYDGGPLTPWKPSEEAAGMVRDYMGAAYPYVTITHRNIHAAGRNSDTGVWDAVAVWLERQGFGVVEIPDTADALAWTYRPTSEGIGPLAAIDLHIRHALYSGAAMNLGVNTGPMGLCGYGGLPYIMFRMVSEDWMTTSTKFFEKMGLLNGQFPWATDKQRLVWENESLEVVKREFEKVMQ